MAVSQSAGVVTLVCPADSEMSRWASDGRSTQYLIVPDIDMLEGMLRNPVVQAAGEVTRVVIDGGAELDRFLLLVATLPDRFAGDILFIRADGSAHFSSRELKTKRTVRTIGKEDVEIYLRWHGLPARPRASYFAEDLYGTPRRAETSQ